MKAQWIIEKLRDAEALSEKEISFFVQNYAQGKIPDYQASAFAMAAYFSGMRAEEIAVMTQEMANSGSILASDTLPGPTLDKHSTGGVGDKVSLPLAPILAVCGAYVPMISGRGLGITGGTLDKLESIPGYSVTLSEEAFLKTVEKIGCAISGATSNLAPADKKLYALRDVTATVPSIPLIASSIMSKKIAENVDTLILDVKFGNGAFMKEYERAKLLAEVMVSIGTALGKKVSALLTEMSQPLGRTAGNALEVTESLDLLQGQYIPGLSEVTEALCAQALYESGLFPGLSEAKSAVTDAITSGKAHKTFLLMVQEQGGTLDMDSLPEAAEVVAFPASDSGFLQEVSAEKIGRAISLLGAGRQTLDDTIDFAVGMSHCVKVGEHVEKGDPLCQLHVQSMSQLHEIEDLLDTAFTIVPEKPKETSLIKETITASSISFSKSDRIR